MRSRNPITIGPVSKGMANDPNYLMAEQLRKSGQDLTATDIPSGLNKALSQILGSWQERKIKDDYATRDTAYQDDIAHGFQAAMGSPKQTDATTGITWNEQKPNMALASQLMMNNPDTQDMGMQFGLNKITSDTAEADKMQKRQWDLSDSDKKFERDKELVNLKAAAKGDGSVSVDPDTGEITYNPPSSQGSFDPSALANSMGVPAQPLDTRGLKGKDAQIYTRTARTNAEKRLQGDDMTQAANKARQNIIDEDRFNTLLQNNDTGGLAMNTPGIAWAKQKLDPQIAEMSQITSRLTPQMRAPGSGSTSNFDAQMFKDALFGVDKPTATNKNVVTGMRARDKDELNRQNFLSDYETANGHLNGADKAWQSYLDANPIFDPKTSAAELKLNKNRKTYQEFFGVKDGGSPEVNPGMSLPGANNPIPGLGGVTGNDVNAQTIRVNSPDEAMKLPSGTKFMTPDGRVKIRP